MKLNFKIKQTITMKKLIQFSKKYSLVIILLITSLVFVDRSFGQTATVLFDYTGSTTTACNGDASYSGSSTSLTVPTTGIPAGATITGISFTAHYGVFSGTTNITFSLNGTSIGVLSASNNTCVTGNLSPINVALFIQNGPNTLAIAIAGGLFPGVYNGSFTVNYTPCTPPAAPTITTPVQYCLNATAVPLTATGSNLLWYTTPSGTGSSTAPTPATTTTGTTHYYVSQTVGCEGPQAQIDVIVNALPLSSATGTNITCNAANDGTITVTGSGGTSPYYFSDDDGSSFYPSLPATGTANWTFTNLIPNNPYRIKVKDANGCMSK